MSLRVATYARYSDEELQDERSIADQQRLGEQKAAHIAPGAGPLRHFTDAGISGASMVGRRGLQNLLRAAADGEVDLVVAESLDRLSRNQADAARIYELLTYAAVRLVTVEDGDVDETRLASRAP